MIKRLSMTIELPPVTKKNSQRIVNRKTAAGKLVPMVIPSQRYKDYEHDAGYFVKGKGVKIDYPVNVKAIYYMPSRRRVDLTNLHEALHDVLVKYEVLADDNRNVIYSTDGSRVFWDKKYPRTEIVIEKLEDEEVEHW